MIQKGSSTTSSAFSLLMISLSLLFECIIRSWPLPSLEEIKSIIIVDLIFHVSEFLKLFMIYCKYGLILLRYFLTDSAFLSPALLYLE